MHTVTSVQLSQKLQDVRKKTCWRHNFVYCPPHPSFANFFRPDKYLRSYARDAHINEKYNVVVKNVQTENFQKLFNCSLVEFFGTKCYENLPVVQ
jgi:hypothetical protein